MIPAALITLSLLLAAAASPRWRLASWAIAAEFLLSYLVIFSFDGEAAFLVRVWMCAIIIAVLYLRRAHFAAGALYTVAAAWNLGAAGAYHYEIFINFYFSYTPILNTISVLLLFYQFWISQPAERIFYGVKWRRSKSHSFDCRDSLPRGRFRLGGDV